MYVGEWVSGHKRGYGVQQYSNGDLFMGLWMDDSREGLGKFYHRSIGRKFEGEFKHNLPKCGSMAPITPDEKENLFVQYPPPSDFVEKAEEVNDLGTVKSSLPKLQLKQPNKVVFEEVMGIRKVRAKQDGKLGKLAQESSGTLDNGQLERMMYVELNLFFSK